MASFQVALRLHTSSGFPVWSALQVLVYTLKEVETLHTLASRAKMQAATIVTKNVGDHVAMNEMCIKNVCCSCAGAKPSP